jgi:hypothetical protein
MVALFCGLEFPSSHLLGVGFTKCSGYWYLKFFPGIVCAPPLVDRGFNPCPSIASASRTRIVDLLDIVIELVCLAIEFQFAFSQTYQKFWAFAVVTFGVFHLGIAVGHYMVWLQLVERLLQLLGSNHDGGNSACYHSLQCGHIEGHSLGSWYQSWYF